MPRDSSIKTVLIIGSGPIVIGQACEFDYSGSQAARSLKEEGIKVVLINNNPATIMTDPMTADKIYMLPLTVESIETILQENQIDAVLGTMGGQTALNLCKDAGDIGIWEKYNVRLIGVDLQAINKAEDREEFREWMIQLGIPVAPAHIANSLLEGKDIAQKLGLPIVIRPSYTLGGTGGGIVYTKEELDDALNHGLNASPVHEVLVEKALLGWKEMELEMIRDKNNTVLEICNIENVDPMGVHTGDSVTIAPAITTSDAINQKMREYGNKIMLDLGNFAGGCNIQFAVNPANDDVIAIEINPRVSRSSALASKATGYPIARIATKLAMGYALEEVKMDESKETSARIEPQLDYVIVKIPRWNFNKFKGADDTLGLQMKSVGEVMGIGKTFVEALQKACQSLENGAVGLGYYGKSMMHADDIAEYIKTPKWDRIFRIKDALMMGVSEKRIHDNTGIDPWFISQIQELCTVEKQLAATTLKEIEKPLLLKAKQMGFSDEQIVRIISDASTDDEVYAKRMEMGIHRSFRKVDTCQGEFATKTPYLYSTFGEAGQPTPENQSVVSDKKKLLYWEVAPTELVRE